VNIARLSASSLSTPVFSGEAGIDEYGRWIEVSIGGISQCLRWIPPGEFWMGSPTSEPERYEQEGPFHLVKLTRGYWLADTACSQALWKAVMGVNPSHFRGNLENPVENVSWNHVQEFLRKLQAKWPDSEVCLPSEAEWEYACRAGTEGPFCFGDSITPELVNYNGNVPYFGGGVGLYREKTVPVKALPPNAWGLYQMHGNVNEWCADSRRRYDSRDQVDPRGRDNQECRKSLRGGAYNCEGRWVRSAYRQTRLCDGYNDFTGFRFSLRADRDSSARL
jgi:formylglycine-generating enzyme required for sulfatase activity